MENRRNLSAGMYDFSGLHSMLIRTDEPLLLQASDLRAIGIDSPARTGMDERDFVGSLTFNQAQRIMGDVGKVTWSKDRRSSIRTT